MSERVAVAKILDLEPRNPQSWDRRKEEYLMQFDLSVCLKPKMDSMPVELTQQQGKLDWLVVLLSLAKWDRNSATRMDAQQRQKQALLHAPELSICELFDHHSSHT